jgi:hypothetical protein
MSPLHQSLTKLKAALDARFASLEKRIISLHTQVKELQGDRNQRVADAFKERIRSQDAS